MKKLVLIVLFIIISENIYSQNLNTKTIKNGYLAKISFTQSIFVDSDDKNKYKTIYKFKKGDEVEILYFIDKYSWMVRLSDSIGYVAGDNFLKTPEISKFERKITQRFNNKYAEKGVLNTEEKRVQDSIKIGEFKTDSLLIKEIISGIGNLRFIVFIMAA